MIVVADSLYFAPLIYYSTLASSSHCIIEQYEDFRKMTFRNRCTIAAANGSTLLTVPLVGGREQRTIMKDVHIDNSVKWQSRHFKTIESAYNRSPWYSHYRDEMIELFSHEFERLIDWNMACLSWSADKLSIRTSIILSDQYHKKYPAESHYDQRNSLLPSTINKGNFEPVTYTQVFQERHGFIPNLSVLDWLFCMGGELP